MRKKTYTGTRTEYANEKIKELYDRINLTVLKGKKEEIKQALSGIGSRIIRVEKTQSLRMIVNKSHKA